MSTRNRYLTVIGGCCALVLLVSCSVELGPNGLTVSLLGETLQFSLGADGLTIRVNAGETTERTAVGFTDYLTQPVQQTPAAGRMILRSEDVTVGRILTAKQSVRMQSAQLTGTATIRFYISQGQSADYCATADFLAEYNMTLTAGVLQIADEVYDLTNDAMEAIASNDVTICVEATADFDGEIQVFDFSFSFDDEDGNNPADDDDDDNVPAGTSTQVPINSLGQRVSPNATYGGIEYGIVGVLDVNSSTVNPAGLPSNVTQTLGVVDVDLDNLGLQSVERIEFASHAAWAPNLPNGLVIATLTCDYAEGGTSTIVDFALGSNTAEWSHERIEHVELGGCAHSQVPILYSYSTTQESRAAYNAHIYSASVDLDGSRTLTRLTLELNSTDVFVANRTWDVPEPTWAGQGLSAATLIGPSDSSGGDDDDPVTGGTGTVTGSVVDAQTGEALAGASISVTDTNISTSSDASGAFSLSDVPEGGQTLTASLTGYVQTTVPIVVFANGSAETSIGMLAIGAGGDNVAAVLAWGSGSARPRPAHVRAGR